MENFGTRKRPRRYCSADASILSRKWFDTTAPGHRAPRRGLAPALVCCALALVALNAATALAQQAEPPRRPQGPAAGPIIRLPRGAGAGDEQPQQTATAKDAAATGADAAPQKWEYCAIASDFVRREKGLNTYFRAAVVRYFPAGREEVEGPTEWDALANAFAKLGDEGWELAGIKTEYTDSTGKTTATYFFKRPKRQE
jgi:hypothetical protein